MLNNHQMDAVGGYDFMGCNNYVSLKRKFSHSSSMTPPSSSSLQSVPSPSQFSIVCEKYSDNSAADGVHVRPEKELRKSFEISYMDSSQLKRSEINAADEFVNVFCGNQCNVSNSSSSLQQQQQLSNVNYKSNFMSLKKLSNWTSMDLLDFEQKDYGEIEEEQPMERSNEDIEDKNLSWLFNFKLDELPHMSPDVNRSQSTIDQLDQTGHDEHSSKEFDENEIAIAENVVIDNTSKTPKKPPFTYTELIEYALEERGELTVSEIYQWISDRFPYYKSNDDRWKNSVRHNLSINPHFRKGSKATQGAGHLWTISSRDSEANNLAWEHKKQRLELFFKMEAAHSSLSKPTVQPDVQTATYSNIYDEAAAAVASITAENELPPISTMSPRPNHFQRHPKLTPLHLNEPNQEELQKSVDEILNGVVHRNVEVQPVHDALQSMFAGEHYSTDELSDYLNPVPTDQLVQESGLKSNRNEMGSDFFITEIDPIELGINMAANGDEILFNDEFSLNYFSIAPGHNIIA